MNHDLSSSAQRASATASSSHNDSSALDAQDSTEPPGARLSPQERTRKTRQLFNKKRELQVSDLVRNIDILIYAELSAVYYMDCSFLRFILRCLLQFTFMTPKPIPVPEHPMSLSRPIFMVLFGNLACALIHAFSSAPSAGEATRGYLHGGLAMDFIGQKGPISRIHLVALDLLIMVLQIICLGAVSVRNKAKKGAEDPEATQTSATPAPEVGQTLDYEERGQLASEHRNEDIELRNLNAPGARDADPEGSNETEQSALLPGGQMDGDGDAARLRALDSHSDQHTADMHIHNAFNSGQAVVANLSLSQIIREQMALAALAQQAADRAEAATTSGRTAAGAGGGSIGAAFVPNGSRLGFRMRFGQRIFRV